MCDSFYHQAMEKQEQLLDFHWDVSRKGLWNLWSNRYNSGKPLMNKNQGQKREREKPEYAEARRRRRNNGYQSYESSDTMLIMRE